MAKRDIIINLLTKSDKKGLDETTKGLEGLGKSAEKSGGKFSSLSGLLGKFGDNLSGEVTGKLGKAGDATEKLGLGLDDLKGTTAVAGAGLAAFAGFVAGGVQKTQELYDATRDFNEVAGTSWEEGSRLIAVFDDLRVDADEGAKAMGRFTRTVGETPEKLSDFGVQVAYAKDGTVDMVGTLENAATAFKNTEDPAKRAALGNALFGRQWEKLVPVLQQGGDELKNLVDGVADYQVATEEGAKQQDELFEATDNLHDAIDGLQRALAQDAIPQMIEFAHWATVTVDVLAKINDKVGLVDAFTKSLPGPGQISAGKDALEAWGISVGKVGDHVSVASEELKKLTNDAVLPAIPAQANLKKAIENSDAAMETQRRRAKEAADAYGEFKKKVDDLLQQQEDMRQAQLDSEDSSRALEHAEIDAGDASFELKERTREVAEAIQNHGAESDEAKIAQENYRRAVLDARDAVDSAADAAVTHAEKLAAQEGKTFTAAEEIKIYRDELIKLRGGAEDPQLIASLDTLIQKYADLAAQAQNAAANAHGLTQAMADQSGIERQFTSRDSSGRAVIRRATGGPVWPGQSYLVGEHGPELVNFDSMNGPGYVLSNPESQRVSPTFASNFPTITRNADGTIQFSGDPRVYPGPVSGDVVKYGQVSQRMWDALYESGWRGRPEDGMEALYRPAGGGGTALVSFPAISTSPKTSSSSSSSAGSSTRYLPGFGPPGSSSSGGGPSQVFNITINGYADISKLVDAIRKYERGQK